MEPRIVSTEMRDYIVGMGAATLNHCMQCGLCTGLCPWRLVPGETSRTFNIRYMQRLAQMGMEGFENEKMLFGCSTCGLCQSHCPRKVKIVDNVRAMRAGIVGAGIPPAHLRAVLGSAHANGNPWSGRREARTAWKHGLDVPDYGPDKDYFLFVCCHSCYDARSASIARSVSRLLTHAKVSFGIIGLEESCCGESIRKAGEEELFQKLALSNVELFNSRGVKKIITTSPHCLWTFRNEYPALGGEWEVVHYTELLMELFHEGRLTFDAGLRKKVAFHDPCYLGRHSGIYEAPRDLAAALPGVEPKELPRSRAMSLCCAGGGGRIWAEVAPGERFGELRIMEAVGAGVEVLTTSCPFCLNMLTDACNGLEKQGVLQVVELSDLLARALPETPPE